MDRFIECMYGFVRKEDNEKDEHVTCNPRIEFYRLED